MNIGDSVELYPPFKPGIGIIVDVLKGETWHSDAAVLEYYGSWPYKRLPNKIPYDRLIIKRTNPIGKGYVVIPLCNRSRRYFKLI